MANENVEELLIRAREAAEEAAELLAQMEADFYECDAQEWRDQIHYWKGFTSVKRKNAKDTLQEALEKLEACENAIPKEES